MRALDLIGVPFDGYGRPGNQASASAVLRDNGFVEAFAGHQVVDTGDLLLPPPDPARGPKTGLVNETALLAMIETLRSRVSDALLAGRFPVVYGGDCTTLLGTMPAARSVAGGTTLLFVDGHEDTMPLDVSEDGEAANCEIGLLLGLTGRLLEGPPAAVRHALSADTLALLGQRDVGWRRRFNVGTLRDLGVWARTAEEVATNPRAAATEALAHLLQHHDRWWLHLDLDVLDPIEFPAQGVPGVPDEPGGLTWPELRELATVALRTPECIGWSLAIYDPDQDPTGSNARQIVAFARDLAQLLDEVEPRYGTERLDAAGQHS